MTASKLIKKLFKLKSKSKDGDCNNSSSSSTTSSSSGVAFATRPKLPQHLAAAHNTTSRFLSLPGEIRNRIYIYATYVSISTISVHHHPETIFSLPIFHICHQIRSEAISHLCAAKAFYFDGLVMANEFLDIIGPDAMPDLRVIAIRDQEWREQSGRMEEERGELVDWLELAVSLKKLDYIVGGLPFGVDDEQHISSASSPGAKWAFKVRDTVDKENYEEEEEGDLEERSGTLCEDLGRDQPVRNLREQSSKENETREKKVFRVHKMVSLQGKTEEIMMPCRKPGVLRAVEKRRKMEFENANNQEQRLQFGAA